MTNSEKFTLAHQIAKTLEGDYTARFALALRQVNQMETFEIKWKTSEEASFEYYVQDFASAKELIIELRSFEKNFNRKYYAA